MVVSHEINEELFPLMTRLATLFAASALSAPLVLASPALARPMTPEDVVRLEQVGTVEMAPDGGRVAYTRAWRQDVTKGKENGGSLQQLFLTGSANAARAWLPDDMNISQIGFSPDGGMVSFLWTDKDGKRAVWGIPADGGARRRLAAISDTNIRSYGWAPDGATIYVLADAEKDAARDKELKAGFDSRVYEEELTVSRMFAAPVMRERDRDIPEPRAIEVPGHVASFQIAPDGSWAAVGSAPTALVDDSYTSQRVHLIDLQSGKVRAVVETLGKIDDYEISPNGQQLSLIAGISANDPAPTTLFLVDATTGDFRPLNQGAQEAAVDSEWMADGRLAVAVDIGARSVLRFYTEQGNVEREVETDGLVISRLASGGNRLAVTASSARHPGELFLWNNQGFDRWTEHNPWLAEVDFGTQRAFTYNARDGRQIEGVLIEPVGGVPSGGAPTIMTVHGGPEAHDSNGWLTNYSMPGQVAAGAGYAVFHPNYRGSTGYGVDFAMEHQGDYAGKEFDDIVDAKHALATAGVTDPERVGITGGSYGGFASAWAATRYSEEYAASVMFVGISDLVSKFGTTDIPNEMYLVHERAWPWDEWNKLLERSPITHTANATTPLLIMHGDSDTRVSPTQSMELYRTIKVRKPDTPVRLVLFPGEGHGNSRTASRYDYNLRMMEWFDTYLKTGDRTAEMPAPRPTLVLESAEPDEKKGRK